MLVLRIIQVIKKPIKANSRL